MSKVTTIITGADGKVTRVVSRRSGCGCLPILAAVVVLVGPAAWFGPVGAVLAYVALGIVAVLAALGWGLKEMRPSRHDP